MPALEDTPQPPTGESTAWLRQVESTDIDEHAAAQPHWSLHYDQLSSGAFMGRFTHLQLPGLRLVFESANRAVRQRGSIGEGHYGFAMLTQQAGDAFFSGQRLDHETMMIGRGEELDLSSPASFSMIGAVADGALLSSLWEALYQKQLASWLDKQVTVQTRAILAEELRTTHLAILDRVATAPAVLNDPVAVMQMRDAILIEWIEAIPAQVDTSGLKSVEARRRVVNRACEVMLSQPDQPMSGLQLCKQVGASPRKLEYCFRDVLGTSPAKYLRTVRLNGVRRDLKRNTNDGVGVYDLAARWGFWHLGEFSADYNRQFGELPSQTLRRARQLR
ncbi:helix-turn-helix domain-containing protein [Ramlibacter sp. WS9]|uniref:helix-turn-helix domain-containing protein n=1 Tax=Ramlibacter sp. WS9 TaxID=1882741 RepID=UPI001141CA8D|nr:helix-turn-helix domain-containing protein [Ramlibacter sp. WS9]ROZ78108.1 helix-turn-helix domain-containing protein [Ramlibacter sp. WS9]HSV36697.1 helix-turn-helix domain-containing protein [Ramlibacter sp.]